MNSNIKVSIIIPVYNVEKYLKRCLESVIAQTFSNLEILLIDDGSTDNSGDICNYFSRKDKRIKVFHKENGGLSSARNYGIRRSTGEYIMFIDSDDWVDKEMVSDFLGIMVRENADFISCNLLEVKNYKKTIKRAKTNIICSYSQNEFARKFFRVDSNEVVHYACGKLFKRSCLGDNQFPLGLTSEDVVGTYRALLKSRKITIIDGQYYFYFSNPESITRKKFGKNDFDLEDIWKIIIKETPKKEVRYLEYAKANLARSYYTLLVRMALSMPYGEAKKMYSKKIEHYIKEVKDNKKAILSLGLSPLRKASIYLICVNYKAFADICYLLCRLRNNKR